MNCAIVPQPLMNKESRPVPWTPAKTIAWQKIPMDMIKGKVSAGCISDAQNLLIIVSSLSQKPQIVLHVRGTEFWIASFWRPIAVVKYTGSGSESSQRIESCQNNCWRPDWFALCKHKILDQVESSSVVPPMPSYIPLGLSTRPITKVACPIESSC